MSAAAANRPRPSHAPRAGIADLQRRRIMTATLEAVGELGYARATTAVIIRRARVSRRTFYEAFEHREEALAAACEVTLSEARRLAGAAYDAHPDWRAGIRAAVAALLVHVEKEPALARLWAIETTAAGREIQARRAAVIRQIAAAVHRGGRSSGGLDGTPMSAELVICGAVGMLAQHLIAEPGKPLTQLYGPIMSMIVLPYLGEEIAREERTSRRPSCERRANGSSTATALNTGEFRVTTRTVRVLRAIANQPGASNREIAADAGIKDPAQISKLMRRLERLGLTINVSDDSPAT